MSEWKSIQLGDTFSVSSGVGLPQHKIIFGNIPVYGGNGINGYHNDFLFEEQRIIIGRVGEHCGNVHLTKPKSWVTDNALVVSFKEKENDLKFWFYSLTFLNLKEYAFRGAQPVITGAAIYKIYSKITDNYSEQRKIARILSTTDAVIEKTQAAIAKYKAIKQGMLHDLFIRGIDPATGKLRPTYKDAPHLYKQSKLGWIPRDWEVEEFKNICDLITDGSHFSPTPIEDGAIIVNVKDIDEFGIDYESCTRISFEEFAILKKQNCSPINGDVLLSKDGTIGRVVLFNGDRETVILSSIAILRPSIVVNSSYLYGFLKSEYFYKQLLVKTSGSALKRIVLKDINALLIAYPQKLYEQKQISKEIIQVDAKLQTEQAYLQKLQQIKCGLMVDLLSGKKKVNVKE